MAKPKLVLAVAASVAPVPPLATAMAVPFQTPVVMVPKVVMVVEPVVGLTAIVPRPRLVRAVAALFKSERLLATFSQVEEA